MANTVSGLSETWFTDVLLCFVYLIAWVGYAEIRRNIEMERYIISDEIFSIPCDGIYIIYAPLRQLALMVTPHIVNLLHKIKGRDGDISLTEDEKRDIKLLIELGLINGKVEETPLYTDKDETFAPTAVTLFLTTRCNLRCIYCYASGGERKEATLPLEVAEVAIDLVVKNALLAKQKSFGLGFHGGGEPTLAWKVLEYSVEYAKKRAAEKGMSVDLSVATNGVVSKEKIDWIMDNFTGVSLSFDGPADIQDYQRPLHDRGRSFNRVLKTVERMNERNFPYGIRATITDMSVKYMDRIIEFFSDVCKAKHVHLEPIAICGRCLNAGLKSPSADEFIEGFRIGKKKAEKAGISLFYSGARIDTITASFCKASGNSFCVTPDGDVTSCYEVCSQEDPRSGVFFYGKYDYERKQFAFFNERLKYLRKRTVNNISFCEDCFCKYHCAGDCLARASDGRDLLCIYNTTRCKINRALTLDQIVKAFGEHGEIR